MERESTDSFLTIVLLVLGSVLITLITLELAARVWVSARWSEDELLQMTAQVNSRKGYISDPYTGYRLEPDRHRVDNFKRGFTHSHQGYRGQAFEARKPDDQFRVVLMGASTIYGIYADDDETSSAQLQAQLREARPGRVSA